MSITEGSAHIGSPSSRSGGSAAVSDQFTVRLKFVAFESPID